MRRTRLALALGLLAIPAVALAGSIEGRITYADGDPDRALPLDADPVCSTLHEEPVESERLVTGPEGGLAHVLVYVKSGPTSTGPVPADSVLLDQKGCTYHPHAAAVMTGQTVIIRNSDPTLHSVHAHPKINQGFNLAQPFEGMEVERTFDQPELGIPIRCDVHPWMLSWLHVLPHPHFAITGPDGGFAIPGLAPGDYEIGLWHEELGERTEKVSLVDDSAAEVAIDLSP